MQPRRRSLTRSKKICFSAVVLIAFVAVAEVGSRVVGWGALPPGVAQFRQGARLSEWDFLWDGDFYTVDPAAGIPGINSDGVRDRNHQVENVDGSTRIVCLGDSVTFGYGVAPQSSYPVLLESKLRARSQNVEVFSVALFGWSTRQERIAYQRIARKYKPNFVILGICLNDIVEIGNNNAQPPRFLSLLYRNSNLVRVLMRPHAREIHQVEELFEEPDAQRVEAGWQLCFEEIDQLASEVKQDGAQLIVLLFPFRFQVRPDPPDPIAQQKMADFCRQRGLPFLDVLPQLKPLGDFGFVDYDHLSSLGATEVAAAVAESGFLAQPDD